MLEVRGGCEAEISVSAVLVAQKEGASDPIASEASEKAKRRHITMKHYTRRSKPTHHTRHKKMLVFWNEKIKRERFFVLHHLKCAFNKNQARKYKIK